MPVNQTLLNQIHNSLGASLISNLSNSSAASDLFEAYVFTLIIEAAKEEGASIEYRDVSGNNPTHFIFRTSPGYIFSTRHPYTHAIIIFPNKAPLELHAGVRVVGKSGVLHEFDVAVIDQIEAEICRHRKVAPRSTKILISIECKFYTTALKLDLARAFIGLVTDISSRESIFVTNTSSNSVEKLLSGRRKKWEHNIFPSSTTEVLRLRNEIQSIFKDYKAR